jgi:hypothetical protein
MKHEQIWPGQQRGLCVPLLRRGSIEAFSAHQVCLPMAGKFGSRVKPSAMPTEEANIRRSSP